MIFLRIKSETKLLYDDVKLLVRLLSKEIREAGRNKLSHSEDMWKLLFQIENVKYYILDPA